MTHDTPDLTQNERERFSRWVFTQYFKTYYSPWKDNYRAFLRLIPTDEGNDQAFLYNLIHWIQDGPDFTPYDYLPEQDAEITQWESTYGPPSL